MAYMIVGTFDPLVVSLPAELWTGHGWAATMFHARTYLDRADAEAALTAARNTPPPDSVFPFASVEIVEAPVPPDGGPA